MRFMIVLIALAFGCQKKVAAWNGIPESRVCANGDYGNRATCIADGKVYICIRAADAVSESSMLCVRLTAEIECTKITNVETVCPSNP
jgi:hypothetical protein